MASYSLEESVFRWHLSLSALSCSWAPSLWLSDGSSPCWSRMNRIWTLVLPHPLAHDCQSPHPSPPPTPPPPHPPHTQALKCKSKDPQKSRLYVVSYGHYKSWISYTGTCTCTTHHSLAHDTAHTPPRSSTSCSFSLNTFSCMAITQELREC